jgi:tetraacyldisaccharide 4'-kinase
MRAPEFWRRAGVLPTLLGPVSLLYQVGGRLRRSLAQPGRAPVPVICVGNRGAGGAGKTPLVLDILARLRRRGIEAHALSRGYGGSLAGPLLVDPAKHSAAEVGDEPLLLASAGPAWIARDRVAGVRAAAAAGAALVVLDDGMQNPALVYDLTLIAVDGGYGFGNGRAIPAGPLRETVADGVARAQAAVLIGEDASGAAAAIGSGLPVLAASLNPLGDPAVWRGRRVVAFAGIGRPGKFFATLEGLGADIVARYDFADHHPYAAEEVTLLLARAAAGDALAVTTEKDWVRVPAPFRPQIEVLRVALGWTDGGAAIDALLAGIAG